MIKVFEIKTTTEVVVDDQNTKFTPIITDIVNFEEDGVGFGTESPVTAGVQTR